MSQDWTDKLREKMDTYSVEPSDKVWAGISRKPDCPDKVLPPKGQLCRFGYGSPLPQLPLSWQGLWFL